jgi:spermidine/putrescine transport system ATP-binding protein
MALLEIKNVVKRFDDFTAVDHVSLSVESGEFFTLLGPSGCGKTTLLRLLAGFEQPDEGQLLLDGQPLNGVAPEHRPVHTVFQSYALFPHMTVEQNVAFPLKMARVAPAQIRARVGTVLENVRLSKYGRRYPHELSGGQRQRVAIARALVNRPRVLLLDEPLSALDAKLREQLQLELINLQQEVGITFVYVTHDQSEALALSHRIAVMNHGRIEQIDIPENIYSYPQNRFVADFIGQCNLLDATLTDIDTHRMLIEVHGLGPMHVLPVPGAKVGANGTLSLRPEKIQLGARLASGGQDETHCTGKVHDCLYLGDVTVYIVTLENGMRIEAMLPNAAPGRARLFDRGDSVELTWRFDAGHFLLV